MKTTAKILFIIALLFLSIGMIPTFVRTVEEKQFNNELSKLELRALEKGKRFLKEE